MEEAEALSTKMGIMVRGGIFRCYGSSQHIKSKYGTGFELEVKIKKPTFIEIKNYCDKLGLGDSPDERVELESAIESATTQGVDKLILD